MPQDESSSRASLACAVTGAMGCLSEFGAKFASCQDVDVLRERERVLSSSLQLDQNEILQVDQVSSPARG